MDGAAVNGPRIIAGGSTKDGFRLVRMEDGDKVTYTLEVPDGCDALGTERWRTFEMASQHLRNIFGFLIKVATKGQENREPQQSE